MRGHVAGGDVAVVRRARGHLASAWLKIGIIRRHRHAHLDCAPRQGRPGKSTRPIRTADLVGYKLPSPRAGPCQPETGTTWFVSQPSKELCVVDAPVGRRMLIDALSAKSADTRHVEMASETHNRDLPWKMEAREFFVGTAEGRTRQESYEQASRPGCAATSPALTMPPSQGTKDLDLPLQRGNLRCSSGPGFMAATLTDMMSLFPALSGTTTSHHPGVWVGQRCVSHPA